MYRIDMPHLLWVLDNLAQGKIVNQIRVEPKVKHGALAALSRMLKISRDPDSSHPAEAAVPESAPAGA
jgi:quinolinate synthase